LVAPVAPVALAGELSRILLAVEDVAGMLPGFLEGVGVVEVGTVGLTTIGLVCFTKKKKVEEIGRVGELIEG
jgi:hypothetical protein